MLLQLFGTLHSLSVSCISLIASGLRTSGTSPLKKPYIEHSTTQWKSKSECPCLCFKYFVLVANREREREREREKKNRAITMVMAIPQISHISEGRKLRRWILLWWWWRRRRKEFTVRKGNSGTIVHKGLMALCVGLFAQTYLDCDVLYGFVRPDSSLHIIVHCI